MSTVEAQRRQFLSIIRAQFGKPYVWGGKTPTPGFDCSGLLTWAARAAGFDLGDPYYTPADGLKAACTWLPEAQALPGDLVLFDRTYGTSGAGYATHCGAWARAGVMLDTHDGPGVGETNIQDAYWLRHRMAGVWRPTVWLTPPDPEPPEPACEALLAEARSYIGAVSHDVLAPVVAELDAALAGRPRAHAFWRALAASIVERLRPHSSP